MQIVHLLCMVERWGGGGVSNVNFVLQFKKGLEPPLQMTKSDRGFINFFRANDTNSV